MPTLNWIGKRKLLITTWMFPYKILEHSYGFDNGEQINAETNSGNKIIHGDNLEALKSLLPEYEGKINCIYIDPPYNTGNEGWVYNDNVNDHKIAKWLGDVVGKDLKILTRHDKWLCMMYPRLKLLHKLLANDGSICISIDDNESSYLRILLDEIFGKKNMLGTFVWRRRVGSSMKSSWVSADHEYVIVYSKDIEKVFVLGDSRDMDKYNIDDGEGRKYASMPLTVGMTKDMRPNQWYPLKHPTSGNEYWPTEGRVWCYYPPTMAQKIIEGKIIWPEDDPNGRRNTPRLKSYAEDAKEIENQFQLGSKKKSIKQVQKILL
jgi:adenine-specific DNA-methyltransferase